MRHQDQNDSDIYYSVATLTHNDMIEYKIETSLHCEGCKFYRAKTLEELMDIIKNNRIHIAYIELEGKYSFTQELATFIKDNLAEIVHIVVLTQNEDERMELLKIGVSESIVKPFFGTEIKKSFGRIIAKSDALKHSATIRLINTMIDFFDCKELSFRMESIARLTCEHLNISGSVASNIRRCIKYLAVAVQKRSLQKMMDFMGSIGESQDVLSIISGNVNTDRASAVVFAILHNQCEVSYGESHITPQGINRDIFDYVSRLYQEEHFAVETVQESDMLTDIIERYVGDVKESDRFFFIDKLRALLYHELAYHKGAKVQIEQRDSAHILKIEPFDKRVIKRCLKLSGINTETKLPSNVEIKQEEGFFTFSVYQKLPEVEIEQEKESESKIKTISATNYISEHALTHDEEDMLSTLEYEMLDICDTMEDSKNKIRFIKSLFTLVFKYASIMNYHLEFQSITDALYAVESTIGKQLDDNEDDKKGMLMALVVESIVRNLIKWRNGIFIEQNVSDIHYLDHSIIADCNQLLVSFFAESCAYVQDIDNDMELF